MLTCGNSCDVNWEISILRETNEGLLVMSPNGDLAWMSHIDYQNFLNKRKLRSEDREAEVENR